MDYLTDYYNYLQPRNKLKEEVHAWLFSHENGYLIKNNDPRGRQSVVVPQALKDG